MSELPTLLPALRPSAEVAHELNSLAEEKMLSPARLAGYELRLVGATVLPQKQTIERTPWGTWLFVDHVEDPTATTPKNLIPIPTDQLVRLRDLHRAGVSPDKVWIGHQLPDNYRDGEPLPQLVPVRRELREKDEQLTQRLKVGTELFLKGAGAVLTMAAAAPLAAIGAAAALGAGLDPIILGGVRHPEHPVVQWCLLAQWDWE